MDNSIRKLKDYVSDLTFTLVTISQEPLTQYDFETGFLLPECKKLQDMVSTNIPPALADEATNELISFVLNMYKNLEYSYCKNEQKKETKRKAKRYLDNLPLFSTVVPAVTFVFLSCRPFVAITTLSTAQTKQQTKIQNLKLNNYNNQ